MRHDLVHFTRVLLLAMAGMALFSPRAATAQVTQFGITPSAGAVGDGRLTAQVSVEGTIICLRWPNATFYEHVKYRTGMWHQEPERNAWRQPYFGAGAHDGFFAGVRLARGADVEVRWLRDGERSFSYASERSNRLVATYTFPDGLAIEEQTFNVPDRPFLVRAYRAAHVPGEISGLEVIAYANPALRNEHSVYGSAADYEADHEPRFATFALVDREALLSALPRTATSVSDVETSLGPQPTPASVEAYVEGRREAWGDGIFLAQGASVGWRGFQVGTDHVLAQEGPQDAFLDAADGELSASLVALRFENTAMRLPLSAGATVAWYLAFGTSADEALVALEAAKSAAVDEHVAASDAWWGSKLANVVLPTDPKAAAYSLRSLISLRTGYDPGSGAIVASTSCQPPYNVDWPRDGAFFQFALELNGWAEEADRHARFYPKIQYTEEGQGLYELDKVGRFPMNAFADFTPGGPIDFEIDNVGFALWAYRLHAGFLSRRDPAAARRFVEDVSTSIQLAADLLHDCRDESNGLQCFANEDDNPIYTQTLHGAITTWLGLLSAAELMESIGDTDSPPRWRTRAEELNEAIRSHFDPAAGSSIAPQSMGWSYWPARFWGAGDDATHALVREAMHERIRKALLGANTPGTQYVQKITMALLDRPLRDAGSEALVLEAHRKYLDALIRQDTLHMSEYTSYVNLEGDGREWINHVATPHIWAQILVYLSLLAEERPELLDVPSIVPAPPGTGGAAGCGCAGLPALVPWGAVLALLSLVHRRRRRTRG